MFRWVGEAYGKKLGFLAIWVQWIESTIWYPTVLTFGAVSIAFIGMNDTHDMTLASNKYYTLAVVLIIYWLATFISLKGMGWICVLFLFDFILELFLSKNKWHYLSTHFIFLLVAIPYQNIISYMGWTFSPEVTYMIRFVPCVRVQKKPGLKSKQ